MFRPRLTVRRLMVAVALAGLVLGFEITRRRREVFLEKSRLCDITSHILRSELSESNDPGSHGNPATMRRQADYFDSLSQKYEQAARYPWLPVEPDPPAPE